MSFDTSIAILFVLFCFFFLRKQFPGAQKSSPEENISLESKTGASRVIPSTSTIQPVNAAHALDPLPPAPPPQLTPSVIQMSSSSSLSSSPTPPLSVPLPMDSDVHAHDLRTDDIIAEPTQTSDSYTVPGSSGTMKETHIFTPIKPMAVGAMAATNSIAIDSSMAPAPMPNGIGLRPDAQSTCCDPSVESFASDTIVIKENVVKKEYRDVEYEPNKLMPMNANLADDFTEFQFAQPTTNNLTNPIIDANASASNNISTINTITTNAIVHQSTSMSFHPDLKCDKNGHKLMSNDRYSNSFDSSMLKTDAPSVDTHCQMPTISESISTKMSSSNCNNSGSLHNNGNRSTDYEQRMTNAYNNAVAGSVTATGILNDSTFGCATDPMEIFTIHSNKPANPIHSHSMTAFEPINTPQTQSNAIDLLQSKHFNSNINNNNNNNNNNSIQEIKSTKNFVNSSSNAASTYSGSGSNILMPQTVNMQPISVNPLTIQWPEPGINTDQLEQLEKRFSVQPNNSDAKPTKIDAQNSDATPTTTATVDGGADDEWSDFVSVVQPQTPITNILNKNLLKQQNNDEDDWSEFVSSTPPVTMQRYAPPNSMPIDPIANYDTMFNTWNSSFQSTASNHQSNNYVKPANNMLRSGVSHLANGESITFQNARQPQHQHRQHQQSIIAPSIISLPDLGFVAPKSLVNMPKRPIAKK